MPVQAAKKKQSRRYIKQKTYNYHRYPCRLPICKNGFDDDLSRCIHESICIEKYTQTIQNLYKEPADFGFSCMYKYVLRQELYRYIINNELSELPIMKQEPEINNFHSEEF
jgi:hypothetical protein